MKISYDSTLSQHFSTRDAIHNKRKATASTKEFKKRRIKANCNKAQLRYRTEQSKGQSYSSHMALFENPPNFQKCISESDDCCGQLENANVAVVFFDLETGRFDLKRHDILQISAKYSKFAFNTYVTPSSPIDPKASEVHGLTSISKKLYKHGIEGFTLSLKNALNEFSNFLNNYVKKKCILLAHNCKFDEARIVHVIEKCSYQEQFNPCIEEFYDSLPTFRALFPDATNHKLTTLTQEILQLPIEYAHDAMFDVKMLEKLCLEKLKFDDILNGCKTFDQVKSDLEKSAARKENIKKFLPQLQPLQGVLSKMMLERLAENCLSYEELMAKWQAQGVEGASNYIRGCTPAGVPSIIKTKKMLDKVLTYLDNLSKI